jgi:Ca-activated chloride channel family protein
VAEAAAVSAALWTHPEWLTALAALCAASAFALVLAGLRLRRRRRLLGPGIPPAPGAAAGDAALWLALVLLALALAGPRIGSRVQRVPGSGVDVVFAVDVSRSMDARDVPPSRLDVAKRAVEELLARLEPADRGALVAYAGRGVLLTPLTPDRDVLVELLAGLDTRLLAPASSHLEQGVLAALTAFEAGSERPRVLVLLGDGEDPERRGNLGAAEASRAEVRVLAAAFGSEVGSTLDDHGVPLLDASGRPVVSRRDRERLERLTAATGGALFAADSWGELDFGAVASAIRRDAGGAPGALVERRVRAAPVVPLAALAFALLLAELLPRRGWPRPGARRAVAAGVAALVWAAPAPAGDDEIATLAGVEAQLRAQPGDPRALVELGIARLERGRRDAASRAFLAAALATRDAEAAGIAYFDLGVAALESGDYAAARDAFLDALALAPRDARARFNLEWTLQALQQQAPVANPEPPQQEAEKPEPAPAPPQPQPEADREPGEQEPEPPQLSEEEQQRWLARVRDDPGRALRAAAGEAARGGRSGGPVW